MYKTFVKNKNIITRFSNFFFIIMIFFLLNLPEFLWPCNINSVWPVRGSQNWTPRSFEPDTIHLPSGVVATDKTKSYIYIIALCNNNNNNHRLISFILSFLFFLFLIFIFYFYLMTSKDLLACSFTSMRRT